MNDVHKEEPDLVKALRKLAGEMCEGDPKIAGMLMLAAKRLSDAVRDAEELANALRDVLAGHPVRNADELIARYSPLPEAPK